MALDRQTMVDSIQAGLGGIAYSYLCSVRSCTT